jgi:hypothetical protein
VEEINLKIVTEFSFTYFDDSEQFLIEIKKSGGIADFPVDTPIA